MTQPPMDPQHRPPPGAAPDLERLALGSTPLGRDFWESTRALAWVEDEAGRVFHCDSQCRLSNPLPGADGAPAKPGDGHGELRHFLVVRFPFRSGAGQCQGHVALDITQQQASLDRLLHLAVEDELTRLYNRRGFLLLAGHELNAARRRKTQSAVLFVDIDGLKGVNDRFGHERGDAVLVQTARVLREVFRESDVVARLGGDEFAVFAADVRGDPEVLRSRLRARLADWRAASGAPADLGLSTGLAFCGIGQSKALDQLLAEADVAMYADKAARGRP